MVKLARLVEASANEFGTNCCVVPENRMVTFVSAIVVSMRL